MLLGMARIRAYQQARRWSGRRAHQAGHALAKNKSTGIYLVHGAGDVGHGPPRSSGRPACALAPCTPEEQEEQQENATPHTLPHPRVSPQIAQCKPRDIAAYMTGIEVFFDTTYSTHPNRCPPSCKLLFLIISSINCSEVTDERIGPGRLATREVPMR